MNHFIEYICRSTLRSEDAIRSLNKRTAKLAKNTDKLGSAVICIGAAGMLITAVLWIQDNEIKALKKQVAELNAAREPLENVVDATEEQNQQEGA